MGDRVHADLSAVLEEAGLTADVPAALDTRCRLCAGRSTFEFETHDYNRRTAPDAYRYYRCLACGTLFLHPPPRDLDRFYPASYYAVPESREATLEAAQPERYKLNAIGDHPNGARLLEIGPGVGTFALLAKEAGYDVTTIEMDSRCCRFQRDILGLRAVESADIEAALRDEEALFDVVALWHVVEHLPDPWRTLVAAIKHLTPNGTLVIAAPNPAAVQFRILGRRWTHLDAPRHLQLVPAEALAARLTGLGLRLRLSTTADPGALGWNVFGWRESLANLVHGRAPSALARRAGTAVAFLARPFEARPGAGSVYTLVFSRAPAR